jgi:hypothetical protein
LDTTVAVYLADLLAGEVDANGRISTGHEIDEPNRACLETLGILSRFDEFREMAQESCR